MQEITGEADIGRHAVYKQELIEYKGKTARGCRSRDFLSDGEEFMESTELLAMHGMDYAAKDEPDSIQDPEASAREFLDAMKRNTTLDAFDIYLTKMLGLDMIVLNADKHFGNITVLKTPDGYGYAPMFDHGRSLALHDGLWENGRTAEEVIDFIEARPFSHIFARQVRIAEKIAGGPRFWTSYGMDDLQATLDRCSAVYPDGILRRAEQVFAVQMQRHMDYFAGKESLEILKKYKGRIESDIRRPVISRIEDGELRIRAEDGNKVFLCVSPSDRIEVVKEGRVLTTEEIIAGYSGLTPLYREIAEALRNEWERM